MTINYFNDIKIMWIYNEGEKFKKSKIKYAQEYIEKMTMKNMINSFDIDDKMKKVIKEIEKWNTK